MHKLRWSGHFTAIRLRLDKAASKGGNLPGKRQNRQVRIRKSEGFQVFWGVPFPTSDFVPPILSKARRVAGIGSSVRILLDKRRGQKPEDRGEMG